jgi:predicted XRE-type DNA-binding protein
VKPVEFTGDSLAMARQAFASAWGALEDTAADAANMRARSALMIAMRSKIESWNVNQTEAARRLGLTQPRLNNLMRGRIDKFSLDALINLADPAGLAVWLEIGEAA